MPRLVDGKIIIGDSNGNQTEVPVTGDVSLSDAGATSLSASKLASSTNAYLKTDAGTKDLLAAAAVDRTVIITVVVTTVFADGDGTQPTLTIGQEGALTKFAVAANFTSAAASAVALTFSGTLSATKKLQAVQVAGTGTTETGAYRISAIATS